MQPSEALSTLQFACIPALHPLLADWYSRASAEEEKGIKVLAAILKYKGLRVFRPRITKQQSAARLTTSYMQEFAWKRPITPLKEMMRYRELSELDYSSVLNPLPLQWIQRWIQLDDQDKYLALLMTTLRSLYTCYRGAHMKSMTTHKASYHIYSHSDLLRASQLHRFKPKPRNSLVFSRVKRVESQPVTRLPSPVHIISAGKPKPVTWFGVNSHISLVTSYQDTFKSHYYRGRTQQMGKEAVSMSITVSPYRET